MQNQDEFSEPKRNFKLPQWGLIPAIILAVFVGIALLIPQFLDQNKYKGQIIQKISDATGYTVTWEGDVSLALLPLPHITVYKASVSNGAQKILSVDKASVSVALAPLLDKRVEIKSITLTKPDIVLMVDAMGRQTWMTDKLDKTKDKSVEGVGKNETPSSQQAISIESIHVESGSLLYRDEGKKTEQVVTNLDADLSADSLSGPFKLDAGLIYQGQDIKAKASIGEISKAQPTAIDAQISVAKSDVNAEFKGVFDSADKSAKGKLTLSLGSLQNTVQAFAKSKTELPKEIRGKLNFIGDIDYTGETLSLAQLTLALGDLNYKGAVKVTSLSTTPIVQLDLASTSSLDKASSLPIKILSDLKVKGGGSYASNQLTLSPTTLSFDGQTANLQGIYKNSEKGGRPLIDLTVAANEIDIDDLQQQIGKPGESSKKVSSQGDEKSASAIKGIMLPFDGSLRGTVGKLTALGKTYSNLKFDITNSGPNLKINQLFVNAVADTNLTASGQIANLPELSGLNLAVTAQTGNLENLLKAYNAPPLNIGQTIGSGNLNGRFNGSLDNLGFDATISALQFAIKGAGSVQSPLSQPVIKSLNLNIRHPSFQSAVRIFSTGFEASGSLNGALDLSSNISWTDKKYTLADIRGNLGSTTVGGNLKLLLGPKPDLSGALNFGKLVFMSASSESSASASQSTGGASLKTGNNGRWSREAINTAWMNKANADLSIKVATLQSGMWLLNNANLAFKLNDGTLNVSDVSAGLFGGTVAANGSMTSSKEALSMSWTANAKNVNAQNLFSALRNKTSDTLTGTISSFNADIKAQGISPAALVQSLSGKGDAKANNIIIKGIDAAKLAQAAAGSYKPLERAGTLFGSFQDGQTSFTDFDMAFTIANGIVNFTTLNFDGPQATLASTGNVNLPRWTVDLKNKMTVKNTDVPPFEFTVAGPLDNPAQTGSSVIENYLRQRAIQKIQSKYGDKINEKLNKLGLPPGLTDGLLGGSASTPETVPATQTVTPAETAPAATETAPAEQPKKTKEEKKAEQIQEGVKALQGLFGK